GLNLFADAYEAYGTALAENAVVLVQGNVIVGTEGPRLNVKECYPLDPQIAGLARKVLWLLHPAHPDTPAFLRLLRETLNRESGDTRVEIGFLFDGRVAPVAEASQALSWKLNAAAFQSLRTHPAVAGVQIETKRLELKNDRRWARK
ncbi:MAG: DNA polymerase III subunit alpha, partial [Opitutaceae bacterium]